MGVLYPLMLLGSELRIVPGLLPKGDIDAPALQTVLVHRHHGQQGTEHIGGITGCDSLQALHRQCGDVPVRQQQQLILVVEIVGNQGRAATGPCGDIPDRRRIHAFAGNNLHRDGGNFLSVLVVIDVLHGVPVRPFYPVDITQIDPGVDRALRIWPTRHGPDTPDPVPFHP